MKIRRIICLLSLTGTALFSACSGSSGGGGNSNSGSGGSAAAWTNKDMQTLVANRCANAGCHDGTKAPNYKNISEADMKKDSKALSQVNQGLMPQGSSLSSSELATFKNFYSK